MTARLACQVAETLRCAHWGVGVGSLLLRDYERDGHKVIEVYVR